MEITYSQDTIIEDLHLLAALVIFCEKIYLPYPKVLQDIRYAAAEVDQRYGQEVQATIDQDPDHLRIQTWQEEHQLLFRENVLDFLPVHRSKEHRHRHLEDTDEKTDELYGDLSKRGLTAQLVLRHHLIRDDLPGIELFESGRSVGEVKLAREIFHLELPRISASDEKMCELRLFAQGSDLRQFWEMLKYQTDLADASKEEYINRGEKIRKDFQKWLDDWMKFRGKSLAVTGLLALCFVNSSFAPLALAGPATATWIGELNRKWVERKSLQHKVFKFISKVDVKIRHIQEVKW